MGSESGPAPKLPTSMKESRAVFIGLVFARSAVATALAFGRASPLDASSGELVSAGSSSQDTEPADSNEDFDLDDDERREGRIG